MTSFDNGGDFDVVVIGAGFSGLGMLRRLRDESGMSVQIYEAGTGVGGTWYWNRYPGARCDSESYTYCFTFSKELLHDWQWSGKYPEQPEILTYLNHVADRFDLRRNIQFETRVTSATFLEDRNLWQIETDQGDKVTARYFITGIGCISTGNIPRSRASTPSKATGTTQVAGPTTPSTSPASVSQSLAPGPAVFSRSPSSPLRLSTLPCSSAPPSSPSPPDTLLSTPASSKKRSSPTTMRSSKG